MPECSTRHGEIFAPASDLTPLGIIQVFKQYMMISSAAFHTCSKQTPQERSLLLVERIYGLIRGGS